MGGFELVQYSFPILDVFRQVEYVAFGEVLGKLFNQVASIKSELESFMWTSGAFTTEPRESCFNCWWKGRYWYQTSVLKCDSSVRLIRNREQESMILRYWNNDKEKSQINYHKFEKPPHSINIEVFNIS